MAKGFKHGAGGGNPLNFKVVGGTVEPTNPKKNMIWVNTNTSIHRWDFSSSEPQLVSKSKNLLPKLKQSTDKDTSASGLAFAFNSDGSITVNGTSAVSADIYFATSDITLPAGSYVFSGSPANSSFGNNDMFLKNLDTNVNFSRSYTGTTEDKFTLTEETRIRAFCRVKADATVANLTWQPMIRKANEAAGYVPFDATGHVWFLTDNANDLKFNALKKNALNVYPSAAKQYVSGAWKDVEAAVYLAGVWTVMDDTFWLYKDGTEFPARTGDLVYVQIPDSNGGNGTPTVTRNSNNLVITGAQYGGARFYAKKINLTDFNKLCFEGTMNSNQYYDLRLKLGVWTSTTGNPVASKIGQHINGTTLEISVANLSGEHYVGFWLMDTNSKITVKKLWLE
jgi:hypothetical protein